MNQDSLGLGIAALAFFVSAALVVLFHRLEIKDSAVIITLILVPLLVYGIASGKILELSGPGGWGAKFQQGAQQKVTATATPITGEMRELQKVEKEALEKLPEILQKLQKGKPIALILYFGKKNYYRGEIVQMYAEQLSAFDPETTIVLVDDDTKVFVASIDVNSFLTVLRMNWDHLIDAISNRDRGYLTRFSGFIFKGIRSDKTNSQALREMRDIGVKTLVVLNEKDEPIAIVKQDEIVTHIVEKMAA